MHENAKILFLDAPDDVLIHRYEGTAAATPSRRPPWPIRSPSERAAAAVDPRRRRHRHRHRLHQHQSAALAHRRDLHRAQRRGRRLRVSLVSFGYSNGMPRDVDLVFDCRFLPNPHWIDELATPDRASTSRWRDYVLDQEEAQHFLHDVVSMLEWQIPAFAKEGKSYLSIAIGCTGGRHRSGGHRRGDPSTPRTSQRRLSPRHRSMRVVAVGGGHGTAVSLRALRELSPDVTGVVSVADDGGSTGRLRAMLNVAAVGDLRMCLGALADPRTPSPPSFEHRFNVGELNGHAVGNLLLVGLIDATGDLEESVRRRRPGHGRHRDDRAGEPRGRRPGRHHRRGQSRGARPRWRAPRRSDISASSRPRRPRRSRRVEAIEHADVILIGPGSLFTSVLAACVVPGITQALAGTSARKIYVANLHPEVPETAGFTLQDHVDALRATA